MSSKVKLTQGLCVSMVALLMGGNAMAVTAQNLCVRSDRLSKELYSGMSSWETASVVDRAKSTVVGRICEKAYKHQTDGKLGTLEKILKLAEVGGYSELESAVNEWNSGNPGDEFTMESRGKKSSIQWS